MGAGYIGSVLVRILLQKGYNVRVVDRLTFGGDSLVDVFSNPRFEFYKRDIRDDGVIEAALKGIDYVCHLAAIVGDPACKMFANDAKQINWEASVRLFDFCERIGVKKFVFASTCSNYGKMKNKDELVTETSELRPVSYYAELKVQYENFLLHEKSKSDVCKTVLRFATVYGASSRLRFDLTVNEFTRDATLKKELTIFGEQFWRPYCHVFDLASSVALVLEKENSIVDNEVYNVGDTAENYTKKMLVEELQKTVKDVKVHYVERNEDPRDYRVNFDKIRRDLGFTITRRVPDGIREIESMISSGIIADPYLAKYSNIG